MIGLICARVHVHLSVVRSTFAMFTDNRVMLVSDNMMVASIADRSYELEGEKG